MLNAGGTYHYTLSTGSNAATQFTNCVFFQNTANKSGGALYLNPNSSLPLQTGLTNCTLFGNTAGTGGCLFNIAATAASNLSLLNCIARSNPSTDPNSRTFQNVGTFATLTFAHNLLDAVPCSQVTGGNGGLFCGNGNLAGQPGFVDAANGDFRLAVGSVARDAGLSNGAPAADFNGTPRPQGAGVDLGAFEALPGQLAPEGPLARMAEDVPAELTIFPNPTGSHAYLRTDEPMDGIVQFFSAEGQMVRQATVSSAVSELELKLDGLPGGMYLVRWFSGPRSLTGRLMIVRP
jgi:predicted outer membrane repeat protein